MRKKITQHQKKTPGRCVSSLSHPTAGLSSARYSGLSNARIVLCHSSCGLPWALPLGARVLALRIYTIAGFWGRGAGPGCGAEAASLVDMRRSPLLLSRFGCGSVRTSLHFGSTILGPGRGHAAVGKQGEARRQGGDKIKSYAAYAGGGKRRLLRLWRSALHKQSTPPTATDILGLLRRRPDISKIQVSNPPCMTMLAHRAPTGVAPAPAAAGGAAVPGPSGETR